MKDSTMILVVAGMLAAAALPAIGTSLRQMARFTDTLEHIRTATNVPSAISSVSTNHTVRSRASVRQHRKGWFTL